MSSKCMTNIYVFSDELLLEGSSRHVLTSLALDVSYFTVMVPHYMAMGVPHCITGNKGLHGWNKVITQNTR